ncbi:VWA domain-containing protein [Vibrio sp. SS-MA-C1-2]|uniref:VWA domain-containing protein n=1 Tax=Vibrio sp. SS-MA-C1-2 TaxID=2908646 RepID=UPI001F1DB252|nr:VWA domain-containing protein [Vibrio sp. SS-MA-C1-2]UJF18067.1 VWA domain-containing protein [Vibrio sp. SS-MA-C1-2]
MTFLSPWWLLLIFLAPLIYFFAPSYKRQEVSVFAPFFNKVVDETSKEASEQSTVPKRQKIQTWSLIMTWLLLVICTAQPVILGKPIVEKSQARDLMVALDLSQSMDKVDFTAPNHRKISRWHALQNIVQSFGEKRKGDRLGLIVFGSGAYLQAPFINSTSTWVQIVKNLSTGVAGPATTIGDAIGLSIKAFDGSNSKDKMLILVTDGNDTMSRLPPVEAAKVAKSKGIKIYTIAIGDPKTEDPNTKVDVTALKKVAQMTGGKSYLALDRNSLADVFKQIDKIEPSNFSSISHQPYQFLYPHILLALLLYYLLMWVGLITLQYKRRRA